LRLSTVTCSYCESTRDIIQPLDPLTTTIMPSDITIQDLMLLNLLRQRMVVQIAAI